MKKREFYTNFDLRISMVEKHIKNLNHYELKINLPERLKKYCVYSYDNVRNDFDIFTELKGAVFALKEALDIIFANIKKKTGIKLDKNYVKIKEEIENMDDTNCKKFLYDINNIRKIIFLRDLRNHLKVSPNIIFIVENYKQNKQIIAEIKLSGTTISATENKKIKTYKLIIHIPKFLENYILFLKEFKNVCCE